MRKLILFLILIAFTSEVLGQELVQLSTRFNDDFREWKVYYDEEGEGDLKVTWIQKNDLSKWDYKVGESFGMIKLKFLNNPNLWELRGDNEVITAKTVWNGQFQQWRISDSKRTIKLGAVNRLNANDWTIFDENEGQFLMYTEYLNDPRDWIIEESLNEGISLPFKMMMAFIVMYHSTPK